MQAADGFKFIEQPDLNEVSKLICNSWARPCWNYDLGLLQLHIMRPSGDPTLAVGQVSEKDNRLASFQAYMPFDVEYYGEKYKAVFASFLTVSPDFQGRGLAKPQQMVLLQKAIDKGYDLYITMCEVGAVSNIAVEKVFAKANLEVKVINVLNYLASPKQLIDSVVTNTHSSYTREYQQEDLEGVAGLVKQMGSQVPLRKIIPNEDIDFILRSRPNTKTFLYEKDGEIKGFTNVLLLEVLEEKGSKLNIYFDNVATYKLDKSEQEQFLNDILITFQKEDYEIAFMPNIGYINTDVFKNFHFRIAPRKINLYIGRLKESILPNGIKEVDSFFMDVY